MPTTNKYSLPWPALSDFLRNGSAAIGNLADAVEAALLPPLLATDGDGNLVWAGDKTAEVPWDVTDNPDRKRGTWRSPGNAEKLVIPDLPGWYLVQTSVTFTGKSEPDVYDVSIRTRQAGSAVGTGTIWGHERRDVPNSSSDDSVVSLSSIVRIPETDPDTGFCVRVSYKGATQPPATTAGNNKLRAYRLSAL